MPTNRLSPAEAALVEAIGKHREQHSCTLSGCPSWPPVNAALSAFLGDRAEPSNVHLDYKELAAANYADVLALRSRIAKLEGSLRGALKVYCSDDVDAADTWAREAAALLKEGE